MKRRTFLGGIMSSPIILRSGLEPHFKIESSDQNKPLVLSTWEWGIKANVEAWKILKKNGRALDAVEKGVRIIEADPDNHTVGIGGYPDREGYVSLDASIMDEFGNAGSVCFLQDILHPVSVARKIMEETPHVMLSGVGAFKFAIEHGFKKTELLTSKAREAWEEWKIKSRYEPVINVENHDTIGMIALDAQGNLSGACTTSGLSFKMHGRVGDSPIIGAGLFVDNDIGAATATGVGEAVLKTCGTFLIVELMRLGKSPAEACQEAVQRIIKKQKYKNMQVGFIAVDKNGNYGGFSIQPGFQYAKLDFAGSELIDAVSFIQ